jgi:hypothetical protein
MNKGVFRFYYGNKIYGSDCLLNLVLATQNRASSGALPDRCILLLDLIQCHNIFMYRGNKSLALRFNQVYDCHGYIAHPMHYLDFHPDVPTTARNDS